jgi:hypothetical protein
MKYSLNGFICRKFWELTHKFNWHYMRVIGPLEDGKKQAWCEWCGLRDYVYDPLLAEKSFMKEDMEKDIEIYCKLIKEDRLKEKAFIKSLKRLKVLIPDATYAEVYYNLLCNPLLDKSFKPTPFTLAPKIQKVIKKLFGKNK